MNAIQIHPLDTVAVALLPLKAGATVCGVTLLQDIPQGHKFALMEISKDSNVIKYGLPIGHATANIRAGEHVHTHNVKTNLSETTEYVYRPQKFDFPSLLLQNLLLWGIFALMGEREFVMKSGLFQPLMRQRSRAKNCRAGFRRSYRNGRWGLCVSSSLWMQPAR